MSKFNDLFKKIFEEVETWNDKPNPPGGNNCKNGDAGSITGNCCKEFSTDPGNIGGKSDTIYGIEEDQEEIEEDCGCDCAAGMGTVNVLGPTPGMPSIADTATQPGDFNQPKEEDEPGISTKDIKKIYSPSLNKAPKAQKQRKSSYPLFKRFKK